jgi:prepilin-type N-terminal cleavage/methylation domain-containing protein
LLLLKRNGYQTGLSTEIGIFIAFMDRAIAMQLSSRHHYRRSHAFTLAEVLIAVAVVALFGVASFATNERLLVALKTQRETTAATLMLQERMEAIRSLMYSGVCSNVLDSATVPPGTMADVVANGTTSEAPLGGLSETIVMTPYAAAPGAASTTTHTNTWVRNSTYPTGNMTDTVGSFDVASNYDLVQVSITVSWNSTGGRTRTRTITTICGKGNRGS